MHSTNVASAVFDAVRLETKAVPCFVPAGVFDAFGWCESDWLQWQCPTGTFREDTPIDGSDPARMVFVFHAPCEFLPRELAKLHAFGYGFDDEWALAPYAIDEATDELFERAVSPRSLLRLAADNLNALFWGLHDWVHFHNHGPFEEVAWTELQCDFTALHWLARNRSRVGISERRFGALVQEVDELAAERFASALRDRPLQREAARQQRQLIRNIESVN